MDWQYVVATLIFSIIAYLIGSISWAILISKAFMKEDIRNKGSGNAGATNALRNYGKKIGLAVFVLDVCKPILAVGIAYAVMVHSNNRLFNDMSMQFIGLLAVVGHIFPIFFKFKGGKGAATFVGYAIATQWILFFVGFATFVLIVWRTRKVSLGSIISPGVLVLFHLLANVFESSPFRHEEWANPFMNNSPWWIGTIFLAIAWLIIVYKHKENIKRLLNGTERKLGKQQ